MEELSGVLSFEKNVVHDVKVSPYQTVTTLILASFYFRIMASLDARRETIVLPSATTLQVHFWQICVYIYF